MSLREIEFDWESKGDQMAQGSPISTLRAVIPTTNDISSGYSYPIVFDDAPFIRSGGESPEKTVIIDESDIKLSPIKAGTLDRPTSAGLTEEDKRRQSNIASGQDSVYLDTHHHLHKHIDQEKCRPQSANNCGTAAKKAAAKKRERKMSVTRALIEADQSAEWQNG